MDKNQITNKTIVNILIWSKTLLNAYQFHHFFYIFIFMAQLKPEVSPVHMHWDTTVLH